MGMRENRFTLMEVLVALVVIGIGAMGLFRLQLIGLEAALYSELATRAAVIAESRLEQAVAEARAQGEPPHPDAGEIITDDLNVTFHWQLEVHDASGEFPFLAEELRNLWLLHCFVRWGDEGAKTVEFTRFFWDYDLAQ